MLVKTTLAALTLLALLQAPHITLADDQGSVTQDIQAAASHHQLLHYLQDQVSELVHTSTQYVQQLKPPKLDAAADKLAEYDPSHAQQDASEHSTATALHNQLQALSQQLKDAKDDNVEALKQQYDKLKQKIQGGYDALLLRRKPATATTSSNNDDNKIHLEPGKPYDESVLAKLRAIGERKVAEAKAKAANAANTINISDDNDLHGVSQKINQLVQQYTPTSAHDLKLSISQQAGKLSQLLDSTKPSIDIDTFPVYSSAKKSLQQLQDTLKDKDNIVSEAVKAKFEDFEVTLESIKRRAAEQAESIKNQAANAAGRAKDMLGADDAAQRTQAQGAKLLERLNNAGDTAKHTLNNAKDQAINTANTMTGNSGNMAQQARDAAGSIQPQASNLFDTIKTKASEVYNTIAGQATQSIPTKGDVSETLTRHASTAQQKAADAMGADSMSSAHSLLQSVQDRLGHVAESVTNALSGSGKAASPKAGSSAGQGAGSADEIVDRNAPSVLESALHAVGLNEPDEL